MVPETVYKKMVNRYAGELAYLRWAHSLFKSKEERFRSAIDAHVRAYQLYEPPEELPQELEPLFFEVITTRAAAVSLHNDTYDLMLGGFGKPSPQYADMAHRTVKGVIRRYLGLADEEE